MKTKVSVFVSLALLLICLSCQDDEDEVNGHLLSGTWIEFIDRADTIVFDTGERFFTLKRGREEQNGHMLPLYGSGIYDYTLKKDIVSLRNTLSSS